MTDFKALAARLRHPEQYTDACDEAADLLDSMTPTVTGGTLCPLTVGDWVVKEGGDYRFKGVVVAVFLKTSHALRFVVEDDRGILHIFSRQNLRKLP